MNTRVTLLPALHDNYIFLLDLPQDQRVVVDPAEAAPVLAALGGRSLTAILLTHHHADHIGGVADLVAATGCAVYGSGEDPQLPAGTLPLAEGDYVPGLSVPVSVMATPGHTAHHLSYYLPEEHMLFCGDTLFAAGCGRLFGGTAAQLFNSLKTIDHLPADTKIYCAHEYTLTNLKFALTFMPDNPALQHRMAEVELLRAKGLPTVPTVLAEERQTNLFLQALTLEGFAALRTAKDNF